MSTRAENIANIRSGMNAAVERAKDKQVLDAAAMRFFTDKRSININNGTVEVPVYAVVNDVEYDTIGMHGIMCLCATPDLAALITNLLNKHQGHA